MFCIPLHYTCRRDTVGIKDDLSRKYFQDPARFADVFNFTLYEGEKIIDPRGLKEMDTSEIFISKGKKSIQRTRDVFKSAVIFESDECYYALLGLELQSHIDYTMPLRDMLQNAMGYVRQLERFSARHKQDKDLTGDAFLCGFSKEDRLKPIISVVLYLGTGTWDGAVTLHDMLGRIDRRVLEKVPDYGINLVTPDTVQDFSRFHTSFGLVYEMFKYANNEQELEKLLRKKSGDYANISDDDIDMIRTFLKIDLQRDKEDEVVEVCKAWDDHYESGRRKGMKTGMKTGMKKGIKKGIYKGQRNTLCRLVSKGLISEEQAAAELNMSPEKFRQIRMSVPVK